jgi:rhamnose transport system ATP-binding protein
MQPLLQLTGITKAFGGVHALRGVSFDLLAGEVHALVGENGAGKSTLIKIITGALRPDGGTLWIAGEEVAENSPAKAAELGVAAIYQQPALFPDLSVAENIALALETPRIFGLVRWGERKRRARELLDRIGARIDPDTEARRLSMPEQQLVEIAKAISSQARIVIMDEPTASLSDREVDNLFRIVRELKQKGAGILYVSHRLEELPRIADRVTALRDGLKVGTRRMAEVDRPTLIQMMVGRELADVFPKVDVARGNVVLETEQLAQLARTGSAGISLKVRAGEILGLAGLIGAGRTEFARVLFGLTPADSGRILLNGKPIRITSPGDAVRHGIAYVPEDRRKHGVIADFSVAWNTTLAILPGIATRGFLDFAKERRLAEASVNELGVKTPSIDTSVGDLSGGNQQKVSLARWLVSKPAVIILDEPTQGVDVAAKAEIHKLMGEMAKRGIAIILISSELPEILGLCDRIAVLHGGLIMATLDRPEATQEKLLELALGHSAERGAVP